MRVEQEKKTGNVESVTLEQVPMEERKSWADVAMIQAGIMICVPSLIWEVILVYRHVLLHLAFLENRDHQS